MSESSEYPLVTFALFAYNQEQYIREAVEAALAQDYPNLEIIFSDDASVDRTFNLIEKLVAAYTGDHRVVLNKNKCNLGVGGHVNRLVEISSGEIIVCAAGDDISLPSRVSKIVDRWLSGGKKFSSIYSSVYLIDEMGGVVGIRSQEADCSPVALVRNGCGPLGASHAFVRKMMVDLGPISKSVVCEDQVIGFRASMSGGISFISEPLVKYRVHAGSLTSGLMGSAKVSPSEYRNIFLAGAKRRLEFHRQNFQDCAHFDRCGREIMNCIASEVVADEFDVFVYSERGALFKWLSSAPQFIFRGAKVARILKSIIKASLWPIYARLYDWRRRRVVLKSLRPHDIG